MNISQEDVTCSIDALIEASYRLEQRLTESGELQAHDWMFSIREVLYDINRLNLLLAEACNTEDLKGVPRLLYIFASTIQYEAIPHIKGHMDELEQMLLASDSQLDSEDNKQKQSRE